jgi:predicted  nucleic acid-binding Zn-ribbon protein
MERYLFCTPAETYDTATARLRGMVEMICSNLDAGEQTAEDVLRVFPNYVGVYMEKVAAKVNSLESDIIRLRQKLENWESQCRSDKNTADDLEIESFDLEEKIKEQEATIEQLQAQHRMAVDEAQARDQAARKSRALVEAQMVVARLALARVEKEFREP